MFARLFAESGLSLDRLRAFLEVAASGSIVKAAQGDPVRQSQYSRQIKELEDFFQIKLVERHGKGIRLSSNGRELARISRFFLLGLSNFQRGCLAEEQTFHIGASATFIQRFLLPVLANEQTLASAIRYVVEVVADDEVERRLHDLTLDFGIVTKENLSRPLQSDPVRSWRLQLWAPRAKYKTEKAASKAFQQRILPLAVAEQEIPACGKGLIQDQRKMLSCESFLEAMTALRQGCLATVLPDFLNPPASENVVFRVVTPLLDELRFQYRLAWNPRLMRLNPHAIRSRVFLEEALSGSERAKEPKVSSAKRVVRSEPSGRAQQ